jgi:hypothetical protein
MPDINVPLLRKSLEHITAHPEEWDQKVWAKRTDCGTACCLAGTALAIQGYEFEWSFGAFSREAFATADGENIGDTAQEELGLTDDEADALFSETNSLSRLWALANDYTDGEIKIPENL